MTNRHGIKSKAKWYMLLGLIPLVASLVAGCVSTQHYPAMTAEQVVSSVQVYGIPHYYPGMGANPVGQWAAVYEGEGQWRVQGAVVTRYQEKDYYLSTSWLCNLDTGGKMTIQLISATGEKPPAPPSLIEELEELLRGR